MAHRMVGHMANGGDAVSRDVKAYFAERVGEHVKVELRTQGQHNYRTFYFTYQEWQAFKEMVL